MARKQALSDDRIYAPFKIAALVETLAEQGVDAERALAGTGLSTDQIRDRFVLTSIQQYIRVCINALRSSTDPATPFVTGRRLHLFAYGMYGYALMSCLSLRSYFQLGQKYHILATPTMSIGWEEQEDAAFWFFPDEFTFTRSHDLRRFLMEQQFTQHVTHLQDVAGKEVWPVRAGFAFEKPPHIDLYEKYLGCECRFDQPRSELHYDRGILDQTPPLAHSMTSLVFQETCDQLVSKATSSTGFSREVYRLLIQSPGKFPDMESIASTLNMTTRTLRRHLAAEGRTFSAILDDIRHALSMEYLRTTSLSIEDIASFVGFSDMANFRKAFKRWTGETPGTVRKTASRSEKTDKPEPARESLLIRENHGLPPE